MQCRRYREAAKRVVESSRLNLQIIRAVVFFACDPLSTHTRGRDYMSTRGLEGT